MRTFAILGICLLSSLTFVIGHNVNQRRTDGCSEGTECKDMRGDSISMLQSHAIVDDDAGQSDFVASSMPTTPEPTTTTKAGRGGKGATRRRRRRFWSLQEEKSSSDEDEVSSEGDDEAMPWAFDAKEMHELAINLSPQSDKFTTHSYQTMYGTFLGPLAKAKSKPKLLEIGLGCDMDYGPGASVKVWRKLLPQAEIWETDIDAACVKKSRSKGLLEGINTLIGDQANKDVLQQWIQESGGNFDVVIDDGGHRNTQIKPSFDALWAAVKPGGLYFLEDLHLGRHNGWDDTGGKMVMSDILQAWTEQLLIGQSSSADAAKTLDTSSLKWPLPDSVEFILCQREACVVGKSSESKKDGTPGQESKSDEPNNGPKPINMCQVKPNGKPTLCQTEAPWEKAQLKEALLQFGKVYAARPWPMNGGGQGINHNFALWHTIRELKPTHIIESGVWAGMSTWLMRQAAGPHTWIFSFDPDDSHIQYRDTSGRTKYFLGHNFTDLKDVDWDRLIPKHNRKKTLVMLDDHQSVMSRVPQLLSNGFMHLWYDDNAKHNDRCYNFAWLCDPLPKDTKHVLAEGLGHDTKNISLTEHRANLHYMQQHLETYYEFPAIYDGCAPSSASLLSDPKQLAWFGLPSPEDETYNYWHGHPPYVKLTGPVEASLVAAAESDTGEPPLLNQLPEATKKTFLRTLNASLSPKDASSFWATYLDQKPKPKKLKGSVTAHTYWHGVFDAKPGLAVKSFLVTQDPKQTKVVVWLDKSTPDISEELQNLKSHGVEVRLFDFAAEAVGTPLEGWSSHLHTHFAGHEQWPTKRTAADLARYVILSKHGGLWFDTDVMFLRPMTSLLPYEFAYPWSKRGHKGLPENHTLNAALLRLLPDSPANKDMIERAAKERIPFGLWGLTSLKDDTRHPDLSIVDVTAFDALWKDEAYFEPEEVAQLVQDEPFPESTRFDWFFNSNENVRDAGLSVLGSSNALAYHWHNRWHMDVQPGSAFTLYESFFDCVLSGMCTKTMKSLSEAHI